MKAYIRGYDLSLVKNPSRLNVGKYSFFQRTIKYTLSTDCVLASSVTPSDFLFRNQNVPPGDAILNPESIFYYSP